MAQWQENESFSFAPFECGLRKPPKSFALKAANEIRFYERVAWWHAAWDMGRLPDAAHKAPLPQKIKTQKQKAQMRHSSVVSYYL